MLTYTHLSFDATKNNLVCCKDLKEHAAKIINYEKKEMIPLTYKKINLIKSKKKII